MKYVNSYKADGKIGLIAAQINGISLWWMELSWVNYSSHGNEVPICYENSWKPN